jgi:Flp pilus assembly protein TadG
MVTLMRRLLRRLVGSDSGAELIEFGLTLPLLLLVVLGMIEFGFVFQQYEVVTNAAREGARIAVLPTYSVTQTDRVNNAKARVSEYLTSAGLTYTPGNVTVGAPVSTPLAPIGTGCVWTVAVTVVYPHPVPFIGGIVRYFGGTFGALNLTATSKMRTEAAAGAC